MKQYLSGISMSISPAITIYFTSSRVAMEGALAREGGGTQ